MAKFKVGDKVRDTEAMRDGVIVEVDAEKPGYYAVKYDTRPQPQWNIPESYLTAANAAPVSANSVVRNAMAAKNAGTRDPKEWDAIKSEEKKLLRQVADIARKYDALDQRAKKGGWSFSNWRDDAIYLREMLEGRNF
jgi:hypothetical protein